MIGVSLPLSSVLLSIGILLVGWTLRKGLLGRVVPYLSHYASAMGLRYGFSAIAPAFSGFILLSATGELAWFAVVGWRLIQYSRSARTAELRGPTRPSEMGS